MAHPKRARFVAELVAALDAEPSVTWDETNDAWDTRRRTLLAHDPTADRWLMLQDDAEIPPHLVKECGRILERVPFDAPVSLYMGAQRLRPRRFSMQPVVDTVRERGASFAVMGGPWWGVAVIVPTAHIPDMVEFGDRHTRYGDDIRIAQFYASVGIECWYALPSIVNHRPGPSLVGRRHQNRRALWHHDGPGLAWDGGSITPADMRLQWFPTTP